MKYTKLLTTAFIVTVSVTGANAIELDATHNNDAHIVAEATSSVESNAELIDGNTKIKNDTSYDVDVDVDAEVKEDKNFEASSDTKAEDSTRAEFDENHAVEADVDVDAKVETKTKM